MAGFTFGLGPSDWLKMSNPLKTVAPIQPTATTAPTTLKTSTSPIGSGPTAPTTSPLGGTPIGKTFGPINPLPNTGTFGNILPTSPSATPLQPSNPPPLPTTTPPISTAPAKTAPAPVTSDGLTDAERADKARAAGAAAGASSSLGAATQAGQAQESTQAGAMNTASTAAATPASSPNPSDPNVIKDPLTGTYRYLTQAEITDRAAHQGMGAAAAAASSAAGQAGKATESANANAMADASKTAAAPASAPAPISTPAASTPPAANTPPAAQPPTPDMVTAPDKTTPSLDDNMAIYEKTAQDWMNGVVDQKVFQTTANRAILQMGLNNSAEMDALKMRINSDPSLAGQGAGSAMLSMMSANQNFNADQLFGQLAESAQQKILDMQKYGLEQGVQINQQRRENAYKSISALQDAGDFTGAAKLLAKTVDFPGVSIDPSQFSASRTRQTEDIQSLMTAGNYQGAAEKLAALTGKPISAADLQQRDPYTMQRALDLEGKGDYDGAAKQYASMGINVTADDLRAQSPFMQSSWSNTLDGIKAIATTNPAAAEAQLAILMKNPAAAKYLGFSASMNPHDLIAAITSGQYAADQSKNATMNTEINRQAKSNVPFTQALQNYKQQGPVAWEGMTNTGKNMAKGDLDSFNKARAELGMGPVHKDANGNTVDDKGTLLTDEDFAETAAAADYISRKSQVNAQPWQSVYDQLMAPGSPFHDQILSIPGGDTMVKQALMSSYLGGTYKVDPNTGMMEPDFTNGMPWDNPSTSYLFHDWPTAVFGADGAVQGAFDTGGDPYGLEATNGQKLQKMPDDEHLDSLYAKYKYTGGTMNSTQWYFATAAGTMPPDAKRVPPSVQSTAENQTNVGNTPSTPSTSATPPAPGTPLTNDQVGTVKDTVDAMAGNLPSSVDQAKLNTTVDDIGKATPLNFVTTSNGTYPGIRDSTVSSTTDLMKILAQKYPATQNISTTSGYDSTAGKLGITNDPRFGEQVDVKSPNGTAMKAWAPKQVTVDFYGFASLLKLGLTESQAYSVMAKALGDQRMKDAYKLFMNKDYAGTTNATA